MRYIPDIAPSRDLLTKHRKPLSSEVSLGTGSLQEPRSSPSPPPSLGTEARCLRGLHWHPPRLGRGPLPSLGGADSKHRASEHAPSLGSEYSLGTEAVPRLGRRPVYVKPSGGPGPLGPLCFLVFVFSLPPSASEPPGRTLTERSKTLGPVVPRPEAQQRPG